MLARRAHVIIFSGRVCCHSAHRCCSFGSFNCSGAQPMCLCVFIVDCVFHGASFLGLLPFMKRTAARSATIRRILPFRPRVNPFLEELFHPSPASVGLRRRWILAVQPGPSQSPPIHHRQFKVVIRRLRGFGKDAFLNRESHAGRLSPLRLHGVPRTHTLLSPPLTPGRA
jgi:hypothetical protein